ncbi:MAG: formamidopyrimidine-DNA glycosylase [Acidobacteria bacterium]|nr:MAG: formamidopyrimidine-DNA glycosylase [Acidobacteriota bacterium]
MPELPDVVVYIEALSERILGEKLERVRVLNPFLLRTVDPPIQAVEGKVVHGLRRVGKRIAIGLEGDFWLVLHLMIAGRFHWGKRVAKLAPRRVSATFDFSSGSLTLTEAGSQKRASLHVVTGEQGLKALNAGGIEVLDAGLDAFSRALTSANHTLKRALTDPRIFSGIGNAYSDEILFQARLSPVALTQKLKPEEIRRLYQATRQTLNEWVTKLRAQSQGQFPEKVTAFRENMAVHGRYGQACPDCGAKVQRIRYATNETNYCARCQTGGKLLADRALSRLLHEDWPRTLEEMELLVERAALPARPVRTSGQTKAEPRPLHT